jgi:hypothetical protein
MQSKPHTTMPRSTGLQTNDPTHARGQNTTTVSCSELGLPIVTLARTYMYFYMIYAYIKEIQVDKEAGGTDTSQSIALHPRSLDAPNTQAGSTRGPVFQNIITACEAARRPATRPGPRPCAATRP